MLRETFGLSGSISEGLGDIHRIAGIGMIAGPALVWASGRTVETARDVLDAFRWRKEDFRWLALQPLAAIGRAELPEADKLNGGQKLNALLTMALGTALAVTGIWLWREPGALVPWFVHLCLFLLWIPVFAGHFFLATLNPSTRHALQGMILGQVRLSWALHHHSLWARRAFDSSNTGRPDEDR